MWLTLTDQQHKATNTYTSHNYLILQAMVKFSERPICRYNVILQFWGWTWFSAVSVFFFFFVFTIVPTCVWVNYFADI